MEFIKINEPSPVIQSDVAITYDGVVIDEEIEGYMTLMVRNREVSGNIIDTVDTNYGVMSTHQRMSVEPLEVDFIIKGKNDAEYHRQFERLMKTLDKKEDVAISFADDEAIFFGRLGEFGDVDENINNQVTGTFSLFRETPFKYSEEKTTGETVAETNRDLEIFEIELSTDVVIDGTEISNGEQTIRIIESYNSSDSVVLDLREGKAWKNGERFDYAIAIDSDFENFEIKSGDVLSISNGSMEVRYRERWR